MNRSYSKIRHIQESNRLLEERMLNDKRILNEQSNDGWLTYGNDKNYQYKKVGNDWVAKNVKTNKEYNLTQLSNNPKYAGYKTSISNLEKTFPGGKPKGDANANSNVNGTGDVINTLPQKPLQTLDGKPVASSPTPLNTGGGTTQPVQYKNEKLPDAPVYYPWIQDGKLNTEKLKQSIEDNSINKWLDELKKLTPEQLTKVRQDLKSSGIPTNLTTTKGTGLYYNLNELLKIAEKSLQTPATVSPTGPTGTSLDKNKLPTGDIKSNSVNLMGGVTSQSTVSSPGGAVFALKAGMTGVGNRQDTAGGKTYVVNKVTPLQCDLIEVEFKNKANRLEYGYYQPSIYKTNSISFRRNGEGVKSANPCTEYNTFGDFGNLEFS